MPIVMQPRAAQWFQRRWSRPQIVIHRFWNWLRPGGFADGGAPFVTKPAHKFDLSEVPLLQPLNGLPDARAGTALCAGLDDLAALAGGLDQLPAFPNVMRHWLLHIDVAPRLNGPNRSQRMPMVGRRNADGINVIAVQKPPDVLKSRDRFIAFLEFFDFSIQHLRIHVAQSDNAHTFDLMKTFEMVLAPSMEADDTDADVVIRAAHTRMDIASAFANAKTWQQAERASGKR